MAWEPLLSAFLYLGGALGRDLIQAGRLTSPQTQGDGSRIAAVTRRHARGEAPTGAGETAALTELAEVSSGRVDLLAQHAGLAVGFHEHDSDALIYLQIAQLCSQAGADTALIPRWIAEGRRRAAAAKQFPPALSGWLSAGR